MSSLGIESDTDQIRRTYKFIATAGLMGDLMVVAAIWLMSAIDQNIMIVITAVLLASGVSMAYLFVKVFPDRIAKARGLS